VLPALKKNKVKPTTTAYTTSPNDDIPAQRAEMDTIVKRMQADGVDTVIAVEGSVPLLAQRLAATDYRPKILATSNANVQTYASSQGNDVAPLKGLVSGDVSYPYDDPALTKCRDKVAKATGETMQEAAVTGEPNNRVSAEIACRYTALLAGLAGATGKNLTTASLAKAGQKAGGIEIPGSGKVVYNPKTKTFTQPVYLFRFNPETRVVDRDPQPYEPATK
ncbi:MAG: ABC transporter substrate-binding protein, partial [Microbacterium sp.]